MARVYGSYNSKGWKPSGSSYYKHYRAWVEYWVSSETDTQVVVSAYSGVNLDSSVSASFSAQQSATDYSAVSGSGKTVFNNGNTVTLIGTKTYTYNKGTTSRSIGVTGYVWSSQGDWTGQWVGATGYVTIPALASYTVSYDANGGENAPANDTKYFSVSLELSATEPTRAGYTFVNWLGDDGNYYDPSDTYTADAPLTLTAQWSPNTYDVTYDKNTGSGTQMQNSTFTYDVAGNLRTNTYTKTDNLFLGWATSADGVVQYSDGQQVVNLSTGATVPLYARWRFQFTQPDLQTPDAYRASSGVQEDTGTGAVVSVYVTLGKKETSVGTVVSVATTVKAYYKESTSSTWTQIGSAQVVTPQSQTNVATWVVPDSTFSTDLQYDIKFTAEVIESGAVKVSANPVTTIISVAKFLVDIDPNHKSFGFFSTAPLTDDVVMIGKLADIILEVDDNASISSLDDSERIDAELREMVIAQGWN